MAFCIPSNMRLTSVCTESCFRDKIIPYPEADGVERPRLVVLRVAAEGEVEPAVRAQRRRRVAGRQRRGQLADGAVAVDRPHRRRHHQHIHQRPLHH